jgi:hypothetical protein
MADEPETPTDTPTPEPPPFDPDPDLITYLERGDKPTREEIRVLTSGRPG